MYIPSWKRIADAITHDIRTGKLAVGDPLPSETELASQWSVSRVTAHRAMHELHLSGLVVRKRRAGTVVADRNSIGTGRIAVFLHTGDYLEQEYLSGIRTGLPDDYDLLYCNIRNDVGREARYLERMSETTDGILCIPTCDPANTPLFMRLLQAGKKIVCVDCVPDELEIDAVISDNYSASLEALHYLLERGHRRIAHFTVNHWFVSSVHERYAAYRDAMSEIGVLDTHSWLREFPYDLARDPNRPDQAILDAFTSLMHLPNRPTAIFCAHDYILSAVIRSCQALQIAIPEDLEIVSFNDCPPIVPPIPGYIHRIVQRAFDIGETAAEHLCQKLTLKGETREIVRIAPRFYPAYPADSPLSLSPEGDKHNKLQWNGVLNSDDAVPTDNDEYVSSKTKGD